MGLNIFYFKCIILWKPEKMKNLNRGSRLWFYLLNSKYNPAQFEGRSETAPTTDFFSFSWVKTIN